MERISSTELPRHLIHSSLGQTSLILAWTLLGVAMTALGGLTAARADGNRARLILGMTLTLAGVAAVGSAVLYHNSITQGLAPEAS